MKKISREKVSSHKAIPSGKEPSKTRIVLLNLKVGQAIIFKKKEWKLGSDISSYLATFKRIGRFYSLKTLLTGEKMIVRIK